MKNFKYLSEKEANEVLAFSKEISRNKIKIMVTNLVFFAGVSVIIVTLVFNLISGGN